MEKILHITEVSSGGVLPVIANICNSLADDCHMAVAYGRRVDTPANIRDYFDKRIELIPIDCFRRELSIREDRKALYEIRRVVRKYRPEIVHMHSTKAGLLGRIGLLDYKGRKYYTPHGYCFLKQDDSGGKRLVYRLMETILAHMGCTTVACGRGEWEYAKKLDKRAIFVNNGIDTAWIGMAAEKAGRKMHSFTVYTAGRIGPQKNPKLFNAIAEKCPDIRFVWIGDGEERKYLTSSNITVTGFVSRDRVIELSVNYDCYLSCSLWEGLPMALLEAMYMEKECIVSNIAGNRDLIENGVNGLVADGEDDFVEALRKIQKAKGRYGGKARSSIAEQYSLAAMERGYRFIYSAEKNKRKIRL